MTECDAARKLTMMVGDSGVDIRTARNAQVKSCGVTLWISAGDVGGGFSGLAGRSD